MSEPDKETLLALLKDKAKELKLVQKKLSKVEDKFVETHKQQKGLIRDRETFVAFLKVIFHDSGVIDEVVLTSDPDNWGLYDINQLQEFYLHKCNTVEKQHILAQDQLKQELQQLKLNSDKVPILETSLLELQT